MYKDELVYRDLYMAKFKLENNSTEIQYYDVYVAKNSPEGEKIYEYEDVLGGEGYKSLNVPIHSVKPDELQKYYVCVTEKPKEGQKWGVVGRACAKVRLYWPQSQLRRLGQQD